MIQFLTICSFLILSGCSISKQTAPIEYHHGQKPRVIDLANLPHNNLGQIIDYEDNVYQAPNVEAIGQPKIIYHEVKLEETIEDIAEQYHNSVSDIAKLNNMSQPYNIQEYQILKIFDKPKIAELAPVVVMPNQIETISAAKSVDATSEFVQPVSGKIISKYGDKTNLGSNKGINIAAEEGAEVVSSGAGKVVYSSYDATYGNLVIIKLDSGNLFLTYAHLKGTELGVGDHVARGEVIGFVGMSGKISSPQLHFGVRDGKTPKNPLNYIKY